LANITDSEPKTYFNGERPTLQLANNGGRSNAEKYRLTRNHLPAERPGKLSEALLLAG
jgi:hypothetical protein